MLKKFISIIAIGYCCNIAVAQTSCLSNGGNSWSSGFNCAGSGSPIVYTIRAIDSIYYEQNSSVDIDTLKIFGVLNFKNGSKIDLSATGIVLVYPGGRVLGGNAGTKFRFATGVTMVGPFNVYGPAFSAGSSVFTLGSLPVDWLSVKASLINDEVNVFWSTASEQNNSHFEVQFSSDASSFSTCYTMASQAQGGNSQEILNYNLKLSLSQIEGHLAKHLYCRIKQVDFDGNYSYSDIIPLQLNIEEEFAVIGGAGLKLRIMNLQKNAVEVEVYNSLGITIYAEKLIDDSLEIECYTPGIHLIAIRSTDLIEYFKVFVY